FGKNKEKHQPVADVLIKNGLKEEVLKKAFGDKDAVDKLLDPIKDKPAFLTELMAALKKVDPEEAMRMSEGLKGGLKDVVIDGDKAKGKFTTKGPSGKEHDEKIGFEKAGGGWKIVFID